MQHELQLKILLVARLLDPMEKYKSSNLKILIGMLSQRHCSRVYSVGVPLVLLLAHHLEASTLFVMEH